MAVTISKEDLIGNVTNEEILPSEALGSNFLSDLAVFLEKINMLLQNPLIQNIINMLLSRYGLNLGIQQQTQQTQTNPSIPKISIEELREVFGDKTLGELLEEYKDMKVIEIIEVVMNVFGK